MCKGLLLMFFVELIWTKSSKNLWGKYWTTQLLNYLFLNKQF